MEKFNIEEFRKKAIGGVYLKILDNGTQIKQFGDDESGYVEDMVPPKGWFYTQSEFYPNGFLESRGERFKKGDFKSGLWVMYDSSGNKTQEINEDEPFKLDINGIFEILKQKKIPFSMDNMYNSITRGNKSPGSPYIWIVEWKALPDRIERIEIDDSTATITQRDFTLFDENH